MAKRQAQTDLAALVKKAENKIREDFGNMLALTPEYYDTLYQELEAHIKRYAMRVLGFELNQGRWEVVTRNSETALISRVRSWAETTASTLFKDPIILTQAEKREILQEVRRCYLKELNVQAQDFASCQAETDAGALVDKIRKELGLETENADD